MTGERSFFRPLRENGKPSRRCPGLSAVSFAAVYPFRMAVLPTVEVPDRLAAAVRQLVADRGTTYAALVREALRDKVIQGMSSDEIRASLRELLSRLDGLAPPGADAVGRLGAACVATSTAGDDCDRCGGPGALVRGWLDLTGGGDMLVERLCRPCRDQDPGWPL